MLIHDANFYPKKFDKMRVVEEWPETKLPKVTEFSQQDVAAFKWHQVYNEKEVCIEWRLEIV